MTAVAGLLPLYVQPHENVRRLYVVRCNHHRIMPIAPIPMLSGIEIEHGPMQPV